MEQEAEDKKEEQDDNLDDDGKKGKEDKKGDASRANEATPGAGSGNLTSREGRATSVVDMR